MTVFLFVRWVAFLVFVVGITWAAAWMLWHRQDWPVRFPRFVLSFHGGLFYGFYLVFFLHPWLVFDLQRFANWGSVYILHVAWYLLFSQVEEDTHFFSDRLPRWFFRQVARAR